MKINTAAAVAVGALLFVCGLLAGYILGRRESPADRYARWTLEQVQRPKVEDDRVHAFAAQQIDDAEALHKAFMKKVGRDLRKISDDDRPKNVGNAADLP